MSIEGFMLIIAGAVAGGFANGLAGFGTGLFALGWWLAAMPLLDAVATVVILSLVGGVQGIFAVRNAINFRDQACFLFPALIGILTGYLFLSLVNVMILKVLVAILLIVFGGFFAFQKNLPKLKKRFVVVDGLVGFIGGMFGMLAGMSGAILTMGCSLYDWTKGQRRALVQPFNFVVLGVVFILMAWHGLITSNVWLVVLVALPFSIIGTQGGIFVFKRLTDKQFQRLLIWLIFLSGLVLAGREVAALVSAL
ncbi:sulfite exporter TauE/SafE family protein [Candidatus Puniceispirillum sp.]|nr:sulfite exporter TauE/SafE family protein [Candidatus Puniceispirillum sp.]